MRKRAQRGSMELPDVGSIPALVELTGSDATATLLVRPLSEVTQQRRNYARVDAGLEVRVAASSVPTVAVNISGSGAVLSHLDGLASGDLVELLLQLGPAEPPIAISGRVTRVGDGHLRAVHFERVAAADRERIVQYVFARQRLEAQRTRRT